MQSYVLMMQVDPDDRYLTESVLDNLSQPVSIEYSSGFREMEEIIQAHGHPSVILLNDRGSTHPGGEMLIRIKSHTEYGYIPVVVLGEVSTPEYIRKCYRAGASTFIIKPSTLKETQEKIEKFFSYWFDVAETSQ